MLDSARAPSGSLRRLNQMSAFLAQCLRASFVASSSSPSNTAAHISWHLLNHPPRCCGVGILRFYGAGGGGGGILAAAANSFCGGTDAGCRGFNGRGASGAGVGSAAAGGGLGAALGAGVGAAVACLAPAGALA